MNTFSLQTRLYSGPGSLKVLSRFSHKHIWIICDAFLARSPLIDTLHQALPDSNRLSIFSAEFTIQVQQKKKYSSTRI